VVETPDLPEGIEPNGQAGAGRPIDFCAERGGFDVFSRSTITEFSGEERPERRELTDARLGFRWFVLVGVFLFVE